MPASRRLIAVLGLVVLMTLSAASQVSAGSNDTIKALSLSGSPFAEDFAPLPQQVQAKLVLARGARVTVRITTLGGTRVRTLARDVRRSSGQHQWAWDGRDGAGQLVADGLYELRVSARNSLGVVVQKRQLRKGLPEIFPANPGAIVIVVDSGHGGRYPGACYKGYCEKDFNLDISLKLRSLLVNSGVQVVMTRTTDTAVDEPKSDVNGDGLANGYDDLAARNDIANLARGDLNLHNHNNAFGCRCTRGTQTFTSGKQPWTPVSSSRRLFSASSSLRSRSSATRITSRSTAA